MTQPPPADADSDSDSVEEEPPSDLPAGHKTGKGVWESNRVTLEFDGPPLSLPSELSLGELSLDTSELEEAGPADEGLVFTDAPLDLDLSELPRRSITPPMLPAVDGSEALELVDRRAPSVADADLAGEMAERFALGDFTGALTFAELLLGSNAEHEQAKRYSQSCTERLEQLNLSRLGSLESLPRRVLPEAEVRWLGLDHRAGFLLSRIDGGMTVDDILDVSPMPRLDTLRTLVELLDAKVISTSDEKS